MSLRHRTIPTGSSRSLGTEELVLHVDIPKGYHIPIHPRSLSCSFSDASCSFASEMAGKGKMGLGYKYEKSGITFTTEGSYVEIGLGVYLRAFYDRNLLSDSEFNFMFAQSGYFKSNLTVKISGELSSGWSTSLKLINDFDIEFVHPYFAFVKTSVAVSPVLTLGVDGKLSGSLSATSYVERKGEIRFMYDSGQAIHRMGSTLSYTPQSMNKDSVDMEIDAEAHAYLYPTILMIPNIKFLRINRPVTLVYFRSGIKLDTAITGKIAKGFVVENGEEQVNDSVEAEVSTTLYGLVQGRWMVRVGGYDFYHSADYSDLYKSGALQMLEWKAQLLQPPKILVSKDTEHPRVRKISFDSDDTKLRGYLHFFYTVTPGTEGGGEIPASGIESRATDWRIGNAPIEVEAPAIVRVRALLYNRDVSENLWSWGSSVSRQSSQKLEDKIDPPVFTPAGGAFEDTLTVSISQPQGYKIYYQVNGVNPRQYEGPIELSESAKIDAVAFRTDGEHTTHSEMVSAQYEKCAEDQKVDEGVCVDKDDGHRGGGNTEHAWAGWPNPEYCPRQAQYDEYGWVIHVIPISYFEGTFSEGVPIKRYARCEYNGANILTAEYSEQVGESESFLAFYDGISKDYEADGRLYREITWKHDKKDGHERWYVWHEGTACVSADILYRNGVKIDESDSQCQVY